MTQTGIKRDDVGRGKPPKDKRFSSQHQPSGKAKSDGKLARKRGIELAQAVLSLAFKGMKESTLKKAAADYYGIPQNRITVEMMLLFRQAEKAIQKADTNAFNSIMNRAFALPKQEIGIDHSGVIATKLDDRQFKKMEELLK